MKITSFDWDKNNLTHISKHLVTKEEIEEAFNDKPLFLKGRSKFFHCFGQTISGRYLFIVFFFKERGLIRVISARNMPDSARKYYKKRRK